MSNTEPYSRHVEGANIPRGPDPMDATTDHPDLVMDLAGNVFSTTTGEHLNPEPKHLSMEDPCPHVSRLDIIGAKLRGGSELDDLIDHMQNCTGQP